MIKEAIAQLVKREDLTSEVMEQVMEEIMTGEATEGFIPYSIIDERRDN